MTACRAGLLCIAMCVDLPFAAGADRPSVDSGEVREQGRANPSAVFTDVDALRRLGRLDAPLHAELIIDLNCAHCAEVFTPVLAVLDPFVDHGQVNLVVRWLIRSHAQAARDLAMHTLAAADHAQYRLLGTLLVGTPEGRDWAIMRNRLAEIVDSEAIEARLVAEKSAIEDVILADARFIESRHIRDAPCFLLTDGEGRAVGSWSGKAFDIAGIRSAIEAQVVKDPAAPRSVGMGGTP